MLKIVGNDVYRSTEKVGYIEGNDVLDHLGRKVGYFSGNDIYSASGRKIAYVEGDHVHATDGKQFRVSENRKQVSGGSYSDLCRVAIRLLLGD